MTPAEVEREVRLIELGTRRLVRDLVAGDYASAFKGRGVEFADVRAYEIGDDVRTMDWRVTARMGTPYVRRYQEERELTIVLAIDCSASGNVGSDLRTKRELAAHLAAIVALAAVRRNDRIGALLFTDHLERFVAPRKGRRHALRLVNDVLAFQPSRSGTDLTGALAHLESALHRRTVLFVISDFLGTGYESTLTRLARQHEVIAVRLTDRVEEELPSVGLLTVRDPESGRSRVIDTRSNIVLESLRTERHAVRHNVIETVRRAGADILELDAARGYAEPLVAFFRRRAQRR
ncbi:MAG: DUF58 domain-containing protein [Gemmatimonadota bacterium]